LKKGCIVVLTIPVAIVLGIFCLLAFNFYEIPVRYRLTLEVQDGDQIKTGSSVVEAYYDVQPDWSWSGPDTHLRKLVGNAPTVDLGERGLLFLTFASVTNSPDHIRARREQFFCAMEDIWCLPFAAYGKKGGGVATGVGPDFSKRTAALEELLRQTGPRDVPFVVLPQLGRFLDIHDPLTLVRVSPYDLAGSFGTGVELKRVILELADAPVTPPPDIWPQWLKERGMSGKLKGWPEVLPPRRL
jgi:hypothetical protein